MDVIYWSAQPSKRKRKRRVLTESAKYDAARECDNRRDNARKHHAVLEEAVIIHESVQGYVVYIEHNIKNNVRDYKY